LPSFLAFFGLEAEEQLYNPDLSRKFSEAGLQSIGVGNVDLGSLLVRLDGLAQSRMVFWNALRVAYDRYARDNSEKRWQSLQELVENAPPPPGLPLTPSEHLLDYPTQYGRSLKGAAATLHRFSKAVYPAFAPGRLLSDFSIVAANQFDAFHQARMDHAKVWNRIGKLVYDNVIEFGQVLTTVPTGSPLVNLISYLEIALTQWTRNRGPGKQYLFHLNSNWKTSLQ